MRYLLTNVFVCRGGLKFEPKWFLPLCDVTFLPPEDNPEGKWGIGSGLVKGRHAQIRSRVAAFIQV